MSECIYHTEKCPTPTVSLHVILRGTHQNVKVEMLRPMLSMTPDQAITLAAHLVCLAEPFAKHTFEDVLRAVQNT